MSGPLAKEREMSEDRSKIMHVGFTGTQYGMTEAQETTLQRLLTELPNAPHVLHHGDCVGADEQAHMIAGQLGFTTMGHPPVNESKRAFTVCTGWRQAKEYLVRNRDIVGECEVVFATPAQAGEQLRSGTWATVRYARLLHRPVHIIAPDGTVRTI